VFLNRAQATVRVIAGLMGGAGALALALTIFLGRSFFRPLEAAGFIAAAGWLWFTGVRESDARPLSRRPELAFALLLMFGSMGVMAAYAVGASEAWISFGATMGFFVWGTCATFLGLMGRRGIPFQSLIIVLLWFAFLSLVVGAYAGFKHSILVAYLMHPPPALAFSALGIGLLLTRPREGIWGVVTSRYGGGTMIRRILPFFFVLAVTVGYMRLQGQMHGLYDAAFGFALFASTNTFIFTFFLWVNARAVNRAEARREQAYASLQAGNAELRRLNDALQSEIEGHKSTEEARGEVERQLFQSQKMEAIGTLASGIAHDFNNILTVILLNAETAHESIPADHAVQQNLHEIRKSGSRAADLIRQIMTFGRKTEGHKEPVRLEEVVADAVEMLRHTLPANVRISTRLDADTPQVMADATQLHQVLLNLGTNAAHAMADQGGVLEMHAERATVSAHRARFSPELRAGVYARVRVSDTGQGMDEATVKRIFDPFFTTKPPGKGTGLGLSVVHGIMRQHQGSVTVYSEPGKGTVFHLYFPTAETAALGTQHVPAKPPVGHGQHVLCVDDNPSILSAITRSLEGLGYRVTAHSNPGDALRDFLSRPGAFQIAVTDLAMPGTSGLDLAKEMLSTRADMPVVLMSGYLRPEDARAAHEAGVRQIVLKPDLLDELGSVIHRLLSENGSERETGLPGESAPIGGNDFMASEDSAEKSRNIPLPNNTQLGGPDVPDVVA
jgi:signal transduction histidine kinase/CheY-like chemotaxis protein